MRGPPMPAKSIAGWRALSAAIRWAAKRSPEASPATMPTRNCLAIALADDAALAAREEIEDLAHRRTRRDLRLELYARLLEPEAAAVERAVGALESRDGLGREAAAFQSLTVDAVRARHVARRSDEGRQVLRQVRSHAGERVCADVHELVHQRGRTEDRPVADDDVAGELAGVGENGLVADLAVVREVHVGHDPVLVAQPRDAGIERRAAVDGHVLADGVVVADLHAGVLAGVFLVLRRRAKRGEVEDLVAAADLQAAVEHHVRDDPGAIGDFDRVADVAVRAQLDGR